MLGMKQGNNLDIKTHLEEKLWSQIKFTYYSKSGIFNTLKISICNLILSLRRVLISRRNHCYYILMSKHLTYIHIVTSYVKEKRKLKREKNFINKKYKI